MTTVPPLSARPAAPSHLRPAGPAPAAALPTVDPIRLLKKYKWLLAATTVFGAVLGTGAYFAWLQIYPFWQASVVYDCTDRPTDIKNPVGAVNQSQKEEFDRFMATQTAIMVSDRVLDKAANDPRLQNEAPKWCERFMTRDGFDAQEAAIELSDEMRSRVIPQTRLIELSLIYKEPKEVYGIVKLVSSAYLADLEADSNREASEQMDALKKQIDGLTLDIKNMQKSREDLLVKGNVDSLETGIGEAGQALRLVSEQLAEVYADMEAIQVQLQTMQDELNAPAGIVYNDELREEVEQDPIAMNLKESINQASAVLISLKERHGPRHRDVISMGSQIRGLEQELGDTRERLLRKRFDGRLNQYRNALSRMQAQEVEMTTRKEAQTKRLQDLQQVKAKVTDLDEQVSNASRYRAERDNDLQNLKAIGETRSFYRVNVLQNARIPTEVTFPKLYVMIPLGAVLMVGLVGGLVFLRELLDQRVKGPADVAMIPRTRVIGMVPDASEDPSNPKTVGTAFRDRPVGVIAESFRQARGPLVERMANAGHKSLLVVAGMPGSGATSVVVNLAFACAAAEQRVLVIDANFRRPGVHRLLGVAEAPGLAEVITKAHTLESAVQKTQEPNLDVLASGASSSRALERLATEAMASVIAEARTRYDLVLIDAAPVAVSGDAVALANRCDASILVVKALSEKRGMVARLKNDLADARAEFLGVLVNGVRSSAGGYFKRNIQATHEYHNGKA